MKPITYVKFGAIYAAVALAIVILLTVIAAYTGITNLFAVNWMAGIPTLDPVAWVIAIVALLIAGTIGAYVYRMGVKAAR